MKKIRNILFDFDGTLVDSAPGIVRTMEQTFLEMQLPIPSESRMRATIGLPLCQALQRLNSLSDEDAQRATEIYRRLFPVYEAGYVSVFPEVAETLVALCERGIRMAIVTSRDRMSLDLIADRRSLSHLFETAVTGADHLAPKPAPDMVLALLERMDILPEETLVVGDTTYDILMGNAAGCTTCAVTYGNHDLPTLLTAHPTMTIDRFGRILDLIDNQPC